MYKCIDQYHQSGNDREHLCIFCLLQSPDKLLDNDPEYFHRFTIVIGVQLPERYGIC